jgi:hypothetical protein
MVVVSVAHEDGIGLREDRLYSLQIRPQGPEYSLYKPRSTHERVQDNGGLLRREGEACRSMVLQAPMWVRIYGLYRKQS